MCYYFFLINSQCQTALQPRHLLAALTVTETLPLFLSAGFFQFLFAVSHHLHFLVF